jgi:hypothetical protein
MARAEGCIELYLHLPGLLLPGPFIVTGLKNGLIDIAFQFPGNEHYQKIISETCPLYFLLALPYAGRHTWLPDHPHVCCCMLSRAWVC